MQSLFSRCKLCGVLYGAKFVGTAYRKQQKSYPKARKCVVIKSFRFCLFSQPSITTQKRSLCDLIVSCKDLPSQTFLFLFVGLGKDTFVRGVHGMSLSTHTRTQSRSRLALFVSAKFLMCNFWVRSFHGFHKGKL